MRRLKRFIFVQFIWVFSLTTFGGIVYAGEIEDVLECFSLKAQIGQIYPTIQAGIDQQQSRLNKLTPEAFKKLSLTVAQSYEDQFLYQSLSANLTKHYHAKRFRILLTLLKSPLARRMSQLEAEAASLKSSEALIEYAESLLSNPPARERVNLVSKLYRVSTAAELSIQLQSLTLLAMIQAFDAPNPRHKQLGENQLKRLEAQTKNKLKESFEQVAEVIYLYAYRSASDEDLVKYIELYETDTMKWFSSLLQLALEDAMKTAANQVTVRFANGHSKG
jgi:hypothetical protein